MPEFLSFQEVKQIVRGRLEADGATPEDWDFICGWLEYVFRLGQKDFQKKVMKIEIGKEVKFL